MFIAADDVMMTSHL